MILGNICSWEKCIGSVLLEMTQLSACICLLEHADPGTCGSMCSIEKFGTNGPSPFCIAFNCISVNTNYSWKPWVGRMISMDIKYSWKLQLEIMHCDCPKAG
jgi:hypothetical protein